MKNIKLIKYFLFSLLLVHLACSNPEDEKKYFEIVKKNNKELTVHMFDGKDYIVPFKPKRTIILYTSLLEPWRIAKGNCVGRVTARTNLSEQEEQLAVVGGLGSPNIELIMNLNPDLVIIADNVRGQNKVKKFLMQNNIPVLPINYASYNDFLDILKLFSIINRAEEKIKLIIAKLEKEINETVEEVKQKNKVKALILFASAKNLSCELPNGDTGNLLKMLGVENVVKDSPIKNTRRVEFSLEKIVELNPDVILVKTMGDIDKIKSRLGKELIDNAAWNKLKAVKENRFYYLPRDIFMYKANFRYPEAIKYLSKIIFNE